MRGERKKEEEKERGRKDGRRERERREERGERVLSMGVVTVRWWAWWWRVMDSCVFFFKVVFDILYGYGVFEIVFICILL